MTDLVMSPRAGLLLSDDSGSFTLPSTVSLLSSQSLQLYDTIFDCVVGGNPAKEYRLGATTRVVVVQEIATTTVANQTVLVAIAWVPATSRNATNTTFDIVVHASDLSSRVIKLWPVSGDFTVPQLDSDTSDMGIATKSVWPWGVVSGSGNCFIGNIIA